MRLPATWDVWVYWECNDHGDISHVRDLSLAGLFLETPRRRPKGELVQVHFLVQEGQIRLDAIVTQTESKMGLGLKFQTVTTEDIPKLSTLINRVRAASLAQPASARLINFAS
jgi:hypothetical protein